MAEPVSILILVAAADLGTPTTIEMARAARESLGERIVSVREARPDLTDAAALDAERDARAGGVARLQWTDPSHRRASLRVHLASTGRWVERSIGFMPSDPAAERGRTLGFAIVAILPEGPPAPPPTAPVASTPPLAPPPASATPAAPAVSPPFPDVRPAARPPQSAGVPPPSAAPAPSASGEVEPSLGESASPRARSQPPSMAFDVVGVGAVGGAAEGIGGSAAIQWFAIHGLALRLGALVRIGEIDAAQAHTSSLAVSGGIVFHPWTATTSRPFGVSLRIDYLLQRQSVTHFDPDDPDPVVQSRWLSGFDGVVGGSWLFASYVELVAGLGVEDVLATTEVDVRGRPVASLPALRPVAEAGLRLRF